MSIRNGNENFGASLAILCGVEFATKTSAKSKISQDGPESGNEHEDIV